MCRNAACGDSELCRDLFQEASIRLWQHISELDMNAKPYQQKAWVEWQVRHVLSHIRKPREMEHNLPDLPDDDTAAEAERCTLIADLTAVLQ